jgi:hypothetical protein
VAPAPPAGNGDRASTCVICMEVARQVLFMPCKHVVCCSNCSGHVQKCPVCNQRITSKQPIFLA